MNPSSSKKFIFRTLQSEKYLRKKHTFQVQHNLNTENLQKNTHS